MCITSSYSAYLYLVQVTYYGTSSKVGMVQYGHTVPGYTVRQAPAPATMVEELKPGQKFTTPTPGFGDRVFYETLLRQRPDSEMAQEWYVQCSQRL